MTTGGDASDIATTGSGATHRSLFTEIFEPLVSRTTPVVAFDRIWDVSDAEVAPGCCPANTATAPATCGEAIDVPDMFAYPPRYHADLIPAPGAKMSTHDP
jgi:hypothetical protein